MGAEECISQLPIHHAGSVGNNDLTLTVTEIVKDGGKIIGVYCSGATCSDDNAIKKYDRGSFIDKTIKPMISGMVTIYNPLGLYVIDSDVRFLCEKDGPSDAGGNVLICFYPAFEVGENITEDIMPGMQIKILPDHRIGLMGCNGEVMNGGSY